MPLGVAALTLRPSQILGQTSAWPTREVHTVQMIAPGSSPDILTRYLANKLQELSGKPFIVDNKVGAFGNIATEYVARSKPDGYTIYVAPTGTALAAAPYFFKNLSFDPLNDFEHITTVAETPYILMVPKISRITNVSELVDVLRSKGDKASYGAVSNAYLVAAELFKQQFGLLTEAVRYKEPATIVRDMASGDLAFTYSDPGGVIFNSGDTRAIATSTRKRIAFLPDIPSAADAGMPDMNITGWWSVHVPKNTPKPIRDQLEKWINTIVTSDEFQGFLNKSLRWEPLPGNANLVRNRLLDENKRWAEYVKIARIEPQ